MQNKFGGNEIGFPSILLVCSLCFLESSCADLGKLSSAKENSEEMKLASHQITGGCSKELVDRRGTAARMTYKEKKEEKL